MAKLYFYYSSMNAGKTTTMLQSAFNYEERGMNVLCLLPQIVHETYKKDLESRTGLKRKPTILKKDEDVFELVSTYHQKKHLGCVLLDEGQFLNKNQVYGLTEIVDELNIPVLVYGLRTDFRGELFQGSHYLLAWADELVELKTICFCGKKATMSVRLNNQGKPTEEGDQIICGGNELYISLCRYHSKIEKKNIIASEQDKIKKIKKKNSIYRSKE